MEMLTTGKAAKRQAERLRASAGTPRATNRHPMELSAATLCALPHLQSISSTSRHGRFTGHGACDSLGIVRRTTSWHGGDYPTAAMGLLNALTVSS